MAYEPQPYSDARDVTREQLRRYRAIDVSLELPNPADADGDWIEHEFCMFYQIAPAERDVGIMSDYVSDFFYANADGTKLSEELWHATRKIDWREGDYRSPYIDPAIQKWHELNIERAMESEDGSYDD